jgi:hypothetical protein
MTKLLSWVYEWEVYLETIHSVIMVRWFSIQPMMYGKICYIAPLFFGVGWNTPLDCVFAGYHYNIVAHLPAQEQKEKVWHIFFNTGQSMVIPYKSAKLPFLVVWRVLANVPHNYNGTWQRHNQTVYSANARKNQKNDEGI